MKECSLNQLCSDVNCFTLKLPIASCIEPWWYSIMPRSWRDWMWFWFNMRAFWKLSIADSKSPNSLRGAGGQREWNKGIFIWNMRGTLRLRIVWSEDLGLSEVKRPVSVLTCRPARGFYTHLWSQTSTSTPLWMSQWLPDEVNNKQNEDTQEEIENKKWAYRNNKSTTQYDDI